MLLNLWDSDVLIRDFMKLYSLTEIQMCNILKRLHFDTEQDNITIFCEETGNKLDEIDVAHGIEFLGKIVSTTVDDFKSLRQIGLATLDVLLENDTPISQHLKKYQIEIKPSTQELFFKRKRLYIPDYGENCKWCAYGDKQCKYSGMQYKNLYCSYLAAISPLATKLYKDRSEIEMFLIAPEEEMLKYSTVKDYPEIFETIENFTEEWFGNRVSIGSEWSKRKQHTYIATVCVKYDNMSYRSDYIDGNDGADASDVLWRYEELCRETYDCIDQVPNCFWDNILLINICLNLIRSFGEPNKSIYAGIKHDVIVPYDDLKIDLI